MPYEDFNSNSQFIPYFSNITDVSLISVYWDDIYLKPSFCNITLTSSYTDLLNKPGFFSIATSGNYNELYFNKIWVSNNNNIYNITGNFGIGISNPQYKLDVVGNINFNGSLYQNGSKYQNSQWITISSNIYYNIGNIGIGKNTNIHEIVDINGNIRISGDIYPNNTNSFSLGSSNNRWKDLYLSSNSIYLDNIIISKNNSNNNLLIKNNTNIIVKEINLNNSKFSLNQNGNLIYTKDDTMYYPLFFDNPYQYSNIVLSNVFFSTSNSIYSKITNLSTDTITIGSNNRFISNDIYNRNIIFTQNLTTSNITTNNLTIIGDTTVLNTGVYQTKQLQIINDTTASPFIIKQLNTNYNIAEFYANNISAFLISSNGNIGANNNNPLYTFDINGSLNTNGEIYINNNNFSNIIDTKITTNSNYLIDYNNHINKPVVSTVASSGDYNDLNNKTWINSANNIYIINCNIGIGTTNSSYKLDINGSLNTKDEIFIKNNNISNIIDTKITITSNLLINYNNHINKPILTTVAITGSFYDISNRPNQYGEYSNYNNLINKNWTTNNNHLYNLNSEFIGIGVNNPSFKLDINGSLNTDNEIFITNINISNIIDAKITINSNLLINYNNHINNPVLSNIALTNNYNDLINKPSLSTVALSGNYNNLNNIGWINSSTNIYNNNSGFIGIGTDNPLYKLDINGDLNINNEIFIKNTNISNIIDSNITLNSNSINTKINNLNTDIIPIGTNNRFIVNDVYNRDILFTQFLNSSNIITSNLSVIGNSTVLNTTVYQTEQLQVFNNTTYSALIIKQINATQNVFETYSNNQQNFIINAIGNVGIANNNPQYKLDINGSLNINDDLYIKNANISNIIDDKIANTSNILINYNNHINNPSLSSVAASGNYNNCINNLWINNNNNIYNTNSGFVGIGKTNPLYKVDINGDIESTEYFIKGINISNIIDNKILFTSNYSNLINRPILSAVATSGDYNNLLNKPSNGVSDYNQLSNMPWINSSSNIYNLNNLNVGIGKTNPQYKLDVVGDININTSLRISNSIVPFSTYSNTNIIASNATFNYSNASHGYYMFLANGSITFPQNTNCDVLVVGAGGNGGLNSNSGGGGAGEVIYFPNYLFTIGTSNIFIGDCDTNSNNRISSISYNNVNYILAKGGGDGSYNIIRNNITFTVFNYTGTIQIFNIPSGVSSINIYCWGAGGGNTFVTSGIFIGAKAGNGGFVKATFTIPQNITSLGIIVGQGGRKGVSNSTSGNAFGGGGSGSAGNQPWHIGGGGGFSGVFINNANMTIVNSYQVNTNATPIIISGAGGGGGGVDSAFSTSYNYGGNGGSTVGNDSSGARIGGGGTQSSGGTGTFVGNKYTGANTTGFSAGGGAGWYGGGSSSELTGVVSGGGGGSSYVNTTNYTITNITNIKTANNSSVVVPGNTESYYSTGIGVGAAAATSTTSLENGGNGLVIIEYISTTQTSNISFSGGSGGGGGINQLGAVAGTKWNSSYSYVNNGSNGTSLQGGNGGSAVAGGFIETITGTNLIMGIGGSGATSNSLPVLRTSYGSGGDGNGGLGTQGIVIIKVPLNNTRTKFDGYINYSNIENRPYINDLVNSKNFIDIGYYNQVNFPLANISMANEWFIYKGTAPTATSNSLIFWHLTSNINSKWWFNGTVANTNNEISDERVKKEIYNISNPLEKLMLLEPKEYMLCDDKNYLKKYGIIAQDVKQTLPEFVYTDQDYIANIYTNAMYIEELINDNYIYKLQTTIDISSLININDELKLLLDNNNDRNMEIIIEDLPYHNRYKKRFVIVKSIVDNYTIEITEKIECSEIEKLNIFIYGKKVNDFLKLDYSSLYSLSIASTQKLYNIYLQQRAKIIELNQYLENSNV